MPPVLDCHRTTRPPLKRALPVWLATVPASMWISAAAHAAGGAQIVDDTVVETPGMCHVDSWASDAGHGNGLLNIDIGCTAHAMPRLEFDLAVQQVRFARTNDTAISPGLKLTVADLGGGVSLGIEGGVTWGTLDHRFEAANILVPITLRLSETVEASVNLGWEWNMCGAPDRAFYGAQVVWSVSDHVSLMAEGFGHSDGIMGYQAGIRWAPTDRLDLDLLVGRLDNVAREALTIGVTGRF